MKKRALVLAGGGSKGAYEAGAIKYLVGEKKIHYTLNVGISAGAINVAHLGQFEKGKEEKAASTLVDEWLNVSTEDVYKRFFPFGILHAAWQPSMYNSEPLRKWITERIDVDKLIRSGKDVLVGAVSLDTGKTRYFTQAYEKFIDAVLASSSFPVALLPIQIDNEFYTDGGVRDIAPIGAAIKAGAVDIDIVLTSPEESSLERLDDPNVIDVLVRVIDIMSDEIIAGDIREAQLINALVLAGDGVGKKMVNMRIIRPSKVLIKDSLDFKHAMLEKMIDTGYEDAKRICEEE